MDDDQEYDEKQSLLINGRFLEGMDETIRNNRQMVMIAVSNNGLALEFASDQLKQDYFVCYDAVRQNGLALQFVLGPLRTDFDLIKIAVNQNHEALQFAPTHLQNKYEFCKRVIEKSNIFDPKKCSCTLDQAINRGDIKRFTKKYGEKITDAVDVFRIISVNAVCILYLPLKRIDEVYIREAIKNDVNLRNRLKRDMNPTSLVRMDMEIRGIWGRYYDSRRFRAFVFDEPLVVRRVDTDVVFSFK